MSGFLSRLLPLVALVSCALVVALGLLVAGLGDAVPAYAARASLMALHGFGALIASGLAK